MLVSDGDLFQALMQSANRTVERILSADQVNHLGEILGLTPREIFFGVERLGREGRVELIWGGGLRVPEPRADRPSGEITVGNIGDRAVVVFGDVSGVVGADAIGHRARRSEGFNVSEIRASLAVAAQELRAVTDPTAEAAADQIRMLVAQLHALRNAPANRVEAVKSDIKQRLTALEGMMEPLGKIADAGGKIAPAIGSTVSALHALIKTWVVG